MTRFGNTSTIKVTSHKKEAIIIEINCTVDPILPQEAEIDACDRMYSAMFRSDPFPLEKLEDWEEIVPDLRLEYALIQFKLSGVATVPTKPDSDKDHELDHYYDAMASYEEEALDWFDKENPDFLISGKTLIVNLCNYKGEGEDTVIFSDTYSQLPLYVSKEHSFFAVN
jgi:hypothetical protein